MPYIPPSAVTLTPPGQTITLGQAVLASNGFPDDPWWPGLGIAVLVAWIVVLNVVVLLAMKYLSGVRGSLCAGDRTNDREGNGGRHGG